VHSSHPNGERVDGAGHYVKESHDGVDVKDINGATDTVHKNTSGTEFNGMFQKHHAGPDGSDAHDSKVSHSGALDSQHQKEEHKDPNLHTMHETSSGKGTWSFNMIGNNALGDLAQESKNWPKQGQMSETGKPGWGNSLPKNEGEMKEASKVDWGTSHEGNTHEGNTHVGNTRPGTSHPEKRSDDEMLADKFKSPPQHADEPFPIQGPSTLIEKSKVKPPRSSLLPEPLRILPPVLVEKRAIESEDPKEEGPKCCKHKGKHTSSLASTSITPPSDDKPIEKRASSQTDADSPAEAAKVPAMEANKFGADTPTTKENMYSAPTPDELQAHYRTHKPTPTEPFVMPALTTYAGRAYTPEENAARAPVRDTLHTSKHPKPVPKMVLPDFGQAKKPFYAGRVPDFEKLDEINEGTSEVSGEPLLKKRFVDEMLVHKHKFTPEHTPIEPVKVERLERPGDAVVVADRRLVGKKKLCRYRGTQRFYRCASSEWNKGQMEKSEMPPSSSEKRSEDEDEAAFQLALRPDSGDDRHHGMHVQARNDGGGDDEGVLGQLPGHPYLVGHAAANAVKQDGDHTLAAARDLHANAVAYDREASASPTTNQLAARNDWGQVGQKIYSDSSTSATPELHPASKPHTNSIYVLPTREKESPSQHDNNHKLSAIQILSAVVMALSLFCCLVFLAWCVPRKVMARRSRRRVLRAEMAQRDLELAEFNEELDREVVRAAGQGAARGGPK
jgi:hypothetical protein